MDDSARPTANILMIDDNPDDVQLTWEALRESGISFRLYFIADGAEVPRFLHRQGQYRSAHRPDLILLDLHLAIKDGHEVLSELKQDPEFACIPVVIMTTSQDQDDVMRAYQKHANCFITKPVSGNGFMRVVQAISTFWLATATLPMGDAHVHR